jgi:hypothetical protein
MSGLCPTTRSTRARGDPRRASVRHRARHAVGRQSVARLLHPERVRRRPDRLPESASCRSCTTSTRTPVVDGAPRFTVTRDGTAMTRSDGRRARSRRSG